MLGDAPDFGLNPDRTKYHRNKRDSLTLWNTRNGLKLRQLFLQIRRNQMDKSVGQARWLLAPIFATAVTFLVMGMVLG